jgi:hypothetical protein
VERISRERAVSEPFIVMSSRRTRLLGVVALPIGLGPLVWGWANDVPPWWMLLMTPIALLFVPVGIH